MPNKLFQALRHGVSLVVSPNWRELVAHFSSVPGAVVPWQDGTLPAELAELIESLRGENFEAALENLMDRLEETSKMTYQKAVG